MSQGLQGNITENLSENLEKFDKKTRKKLKAKDSYGYKKLEVEQYL